MSEEERKERKELSEFVFKDFREDEKFKRLKVKQNIDKSASVDPVEAINIYHKKSKSTPDAERWDYALDSYKEYKCFEKDYEKKNGFLFYKDIKITADVLTGPNEIISLAKQCGKCDSDSLKLFWSVAYTAGNLCPVMKNPGGRKGKEGGVDTCWHKMERFLYPKATIRKISSAYLDSKGKIINHLGRRTAENMFCLFPDELKQAEVINNLMLNDYDDDYDDYKVSLDIERFKTGTELLDYYSRLIVKRGIRIYYNSKKKIDDLKLNKLAEELINEKKKELQNSAHA